MAKQKILRGKVAHVISQFEIAINLGRKDGVEQGMQFEVLGQKPIIDPDTHQELGIYDYPKVKVQLVRIEERYSFASTKVVHPYYSIGVPAIPNWGNLFSLETPQRQSLSTKELFDPEVSIGDVVMQVNE